MSANGCSGGMDSLARWWNKYLRRAGDDRRLAFTGCCDEHDLFYGQGGVRNGRSFLRHLWEEARDRWFADGILRRCIAANLRKRGRPWWVRAHVPWVFWLGVRLGGWFYWGK
jgi:hypothetical protein